MKTNILNEKAVEYSLKAERKEFKNVQIKNSKDIANYARNFYFDDIIIFESTFAVFVNTAGETVGYAKISQGGVSGTSVDIRIILKYALDNLASGIFLVHNHPSGTLNPSPQDIALTKKLREASRWMDMELLDSIILSESGYFSMADGGII